MKQARDRRDAARRQVADGIDPSVKRQAGKSAVVDTFEAIARQWIERFSKTWAARHADKVFRRMELGLFLWIGGQSIKKIEAPEILACLRRMEAEGHLEMASRASELRPHLSICDCHRVRELHSVPRSPRREEPRRHSG